MDWNAVTAIASTVSMVAFVATAVYVRGQLKSLEQDRYVAITNELFTVWQSRDFMEAQLWLLHRMEARSWQEFVQSHRADYGEAAFHRVGSFYDRVGTLVRRGFVDEEEVLSTMGAYAIAVWQKIGPLVREARQIENSVLFDDFERLLPACHACYVPAIGKDAQVVPFSLVQPDDRISPEELRRMLDRKLPITVLDVRKPDDRGGSPALAGAVAIPAGEVERRRAELPRDREVIVYCG